MYVFIKYTLFFLPIITLPCSNYNDALTTFSMISKGLSAKLPKKNFNKTELFCERRTEKHTNIREYVLEVLHWRNVLCRIS